MQGGIVVIVATITNGGDGTDVLATWVVVQDTSVRKITSTGTTQNTTLTGVTGGTASARSVAML